MPLPEGYLPRRGDIVLVQARAKRDAYPDEPDIQCYFEIVGHETNKFFMTASEIHSIYSRNWNVGDTVSHTGMFEGPGEVLAVDGNEVWVRDTENERWTIDANELQPYVEPTVRADDFVSVSVDIPLAGGTKIPNEALLIAPVPPAPGVFFSGGIAGNFMTVGRLRDCNERILVGGEVHGCGVAEGTTVAYQISPSDGPQGGPGVYCVNPQQTVSFATLEIRPPVLAPRSEVNGDDMPI